MQDDRAVASLHMVLAYLFAGLRFTDIWAVGAFVMTHPPDADPKSPESGRFARRSCPAALISKSGRQGAVNRINFQAGKLR